MLRRSLVFRNVVEKPFKGMTDPKAPLLKASSTGARTPSIDDLRTMDPSTLPSTIPGVSREELAEKIKAYTAAHVKESKDGDAARRETLIRYKKNTLSEESFNHWYKNEFLLEEAVALVEAQKLADMSPSQLQRYLDKKKRRRNRSQNLWVCFYLAVPYMTFVCIWKWWGVFWH